jgi:hypothetical protein
MSAYLPPMNPYAVYNACVEAARAKTIAVDGLVYNVTKFDIGHKRAVCYAWMDVQAEFGDVDNPTIKYVQSHFKIIVQKKGYKVSLPNDDVWHVIDKWRLAGDECSVTPHCGGKRSNPAMDGSNAD